MPKLCALATALLLVVLEPSRVIAQAFEAPAACGSRADFEAKIAALLGRQTELPALEVAITPGHADSYRLALKLDNESRTLEDRDCSLLMRSAALIVATHIDPNLVVPPTPQEESSGTTIGQETPGELRPEESPKEPAAFAVPERPSEPEVPPPAVETTMPSAPAPDESVGTDENAGSAPWFVEVGLAGGIALQQVPALSPHLEVLARLSQAALSLQLGLHYTLPQQRRRDPAYGVQVGVLGATLLAGYAPIPELGLRIGPNLAWVRGRGTGATPAPQGGGALALGLQAEVSPRLCLQPSLCGELAVSARYALTRPSFELSGLGQLYRIPSWSGAVVLRLLLRIP